MKGTHFQESFVQRRELHMLEQRYVNGPIAVMIIKIMYKNQDNCFPVDHKSQNERAPKQKRYTSKWTCTVLGNQHNIYALQLYDTDIHNNLEIRTFSHEKTLCQQFVIIEITYIVSFRCQRLKETK